MITFTYYIFLSKLYGSWTQNFNSTITSNNLENKQTQRFLHFKNTIFTFGVIFLHISYCTKGCWTTRLEPDENQPISSNLGPTGYSCRKLTCLKNDGWKTIFPFLQWSLFRGHSFILRSCIFRDSFHQLAEGDLSYAKAQENLRLREELGLDLVPRGGKDSGFQAFFQKWGPQKAVIRSRVMKLHSQGWNIPSDDPFTRPCIEVTTPFITIVGAHIVVHQAF